MRFAVNDQRKGRYGDVEELSESLVGSLPMFPGYNLLVEVFGGFVVGDFHYGTGPLTVLADKGDYVRA